MIPNGPRCLSGAATNRRNFPEEKWLLKAVLMLRTFADVLVLCLRNNGYFSDTTFVGFTGARPKTGTTESGNTPRCCCWTSLTRAMSAWGEELLLRKTHEAQTHSKTSPGDCLSPSAKSYSHLPAGQRLPLGHARSRPQGRKARRRVTIGSIFPSPRTNSLSGGTRGPTRTGSGRLKQWARRVGNG